MATCLVAARSQGTATLQLINGRVWTGDARQRWAQAVAIQGDRIVAVGTDRDVARWRGNSTRVVDLAGRFALPGFNDAHIHITGGALRLFEVDLNGAGSLAEMQRRVAQFARENPNEPWVLGYGWQYSDLPDRLPHRRDLDAVVPDRPVFLSAYDGHTGWANSKALELAGVTRATHFTGYGEIVRDAEGEPTGVFKEGAQGLVRRAVPEPTRGKRLAALRRGLRWLSAMGVTSLQNASGSLDDLTLYEELDRTGDLVVRVSIAASVGPWTTEADIERIAAAARKHCGLPCGNAKLRLGAIKMVLDGVIETHTAAMLEPYSDAPAARGTPSYTPEQLKRAVAAADKAGLQIYIHAIGDRAVRMALDAFEHARSSNGRRDSRHRIEHIETVSPPDIPRFARLGVLASMEPIHADPGTVDVWARAVGPHRVRRAFAWRSLERAGARLLFSSDWPAAISAHPLRGLHNAVNRQTIEGQPPGGWVAQQRVSVATALAAYTRAGAYASFEEKLKGMLAPGMLADVAVLTCDPFRIPPARLHTCQVALTIFDGRIVHDDAPR